MNQNELQHQGVKGMKWGVRKDKYKAMNRQQRRAAKEKYLKTPEGKQYQVKRNTIVGTIIGGPAVGIAAGVITAKRNGTLQKSAAKGKKYVEEKLMTTKTVYIKDLPKQNTRVTGKEEAEFWKALAAEYQKGNVNFD